MIVVDTSALLAILQNEPAALACAVKLASDPQRAISAGTLAEANIVAGRRGVRVELEELVESYGLEVVEVTADRARRVGDAYARWGKGIHIAGLNFGDCFAYALAMERFAPLLFVGDDFPQTDVKSAVDPPPV